MSEKELLYLEDALGHEKILIELGEYAKKSFKDDKLILFMENELRIHKEYCHKLMKFLEGEAK